MRSRIIIKCRKRFCFVYERIMEWLYSIMYRAMPKRRTRNNLIEEYTINERYANESFIRDFLEERTRKAITNRYCIKIKSTPGNDGIHESDKNGTTAIGTVSLLRKNTLIDQATLVIKNDGNNLIYWKFNK